MTRSRGITPRRVVLAALGVAALTVSVLAVISWGIPMRVSIPLGTAGDWGIEIDGGLVTLTSVTGREPFVRDPSPTTVSVEELEEQLKATPFKPVALESPKTLRWERWFGFNYRSYVIPREWRGGWTERRLTLPAWFFFFLFVAWPAIAFYRMATQKPRPPGAKESAAN